MESEFSNKKRLVAEQMQRLDHAAAGIQQLFGFVGENDFDIMALARWARSISAL